MVKEIRKKLSSDFRIIADFFYDKRTKGTNFKPSEQQIKHIYEILDFLAVFTGDKEYASVKSEIMEEAKKGKVISMCTVLQSYKQEGRQEGKIFITNSLLKKDIL